MADYTFNAKEVFDIAIQIERNAAEFYRMAMTLVNDPDARKQLQDLAEMEDDHTDVFGELQAHLLSEEIKTQWFDPEGEAAAYLKVIAGKNIFDTSKDIRDVLPPAATMRDILELALKMEEISVLYYTGMQQMVPKDLGGDEIAALVAQEMSHVTLLTRKIQELGVSC
jgi:rubrerythrin